MSHHSGDLQNHLFRSAELLVSAGSGTRFRTLILQLFGNILKINILDILPIPCPLTDSFESEFPTDVCDVPDTFRRVLLEYLDEVRRCAPLPRTVYLVRARAIVSCFTVTRRFPPGRFGN